MKKRILLIIVFLSVTIVKANSNFPSLLQKLQKSVKTIEVKKGTIEQHIKEKEAGVILFSSIFTTEKGKTTTTDYEINIADVDIHMVKEFTKRDLIYVQLKISQNQKFIKITKDGMLKPYVNFVRIHATDIDNAREIRDIIKEMIPVSEEIQNNRVSVSTYKDQIDFLHENITEVSLGKNYYEQTFAIDDEKVVFEVIANKGKKATRKQYIYNLADINEKSIFIKVQGTKINLTFETNRKQKLITVLKNEIQVPFINKISILANSINQARDLSIVLKKVIPIAREKVIKSLPNLSGYSSYINVLNENIGEIVIGKNHYTQNFSDDCPTIFSFNHQGAKKLKTLLFKLNFADIRERSIDYKISGSLMKVRLVTTNKEKLISEEKDSKTASYTDKTSIICKSSDEARVVIHVLKALAKYCKENEKRLVPEGSSEEKLNWLSQNITDVESGKKTYQQSFMKSESGKEKYEFKSVTASKSKSTELLYEFNLSDIDPKSVTYKISGKSLSILLASNYKSKIIKVYKDGEVGSYKNLIQIYFNDVETAKNSIIAFKEIIEALE